MRFQTAARLTPRCLARAAPETPWVEASRKARRIWESEFTRNRDRGPRQEPSG